MRHDANTPRSITLAGHRLDSNILQELEEIDTLLSSLDHVLGDASDLAQLGALAPLFAHEVNNLMSQVGGRAQLALMHPEEPELVGKALRLSLRASNHIAQLATIFLDSSRPDARSPEHHLVREIHAQSLGFMPEGDVEAFGCTLYETTPDVAVDVLPVLLQQVLLNLYLNASRAVRQAPSSPAARITTRADLLDAGPGCSTGNTAQVRIIVQDTGIGMTPAQIEQALSGRAVDRPASGAPDDEVRDTYGGRGLGLAVCRRLLNEAGGSLACESTPGKGTRMIIILPAARKSPDSPPPA